MRKGQTVRVAGRWKGVLRGRVNNVGGWWVDWVHPERDPESPRGKFWNEDEMTPWSRKETPKQKAK